MQMATGLPKEVEALGQVLAALQALDEGQREWVISSAMTNLGLAAHPAKAAGAATQHKASAEKPVYSAQPGTPKDFLREKNPQTDVQRIACLAYFLTHQRGQPHFKTKDLTLLNTEAAATKLSNPSFAVNNAAKQSHFLAPAGNGNKQITAFGEDVVNALPDQDAVRALGEGQKKRKSRKARANAGGARGAERRPKGGK
jgi:hypothetical protein